MSGNIKRTGEFVVRSSYNVASDSIEALRGSGALRAVYDYDFFLEAKYYPSEEECQLLASPIAVFLSRCTSYDILGTSTQVVVLNIDVALTVAFIAAQETRLVACLLWDSCRCVFCGTLSPTDYIEILLYCNDHPDERENVACYTIRQWLEKKRTLANCNDETDANGTKNSQFAVERFLSCSSLVTCTPETPLRECLQRLVRHNARRIAVLAKKEADDFSVVAMVDMQQILVYLGAVFFSIEAAGGGNDAGSLTRLSVHSDSTPDGVEPSEGDIFVNDVTLPLHVRNLLFAPTEGEADNFFTGFGKEPRVGPYCSIFDIPFCYVPQLGKHRDRAIFVTLESSLFEALRLILQYDIDTIAVVSDEHIIVDIIDRSDIVRIEDQGVYDTQLTVREALRGRVGGKVCVFYAKNALRDIFVYFVKQRVKELFLVDPETDKLVGQLNVAELVFFLVFGIAVGDRYTGDNRASRNSDTATGIASSSTTVGQNRTDSVICDLVNRMEGEL